MKPSGGQVESRQPMLTARGLRKSFSGFVAVDGVDLTVREGSIHALIGPNGAGKTTLFNLLTRTVGLTEGRIDFDGHDISNLSPASVARLGMVRSFQISAVFGRLTVLDNVRVALQRVRGVDKAWWRSRASLDQLNERAFELLGAVRLERDAGRMAGALSYGRKRALELATTLALEPKLLLLDEPLAGMGHEDIGMVEELIRSVAKGRTVLMIEHNLGVVANLCDTITVLARGQRLAEGDYAFVSAHAGVKSAYLGAEA